MVVRRRSSVISSHYIKPTLMQTILLVSAIFFLAAFTRATIGFGDALLAMPLLSLVVGVRVATPLFALVGLAYTAVFLAKSWHNIQFRAAGSLILASACGIPLGLWLVNIAPERLILGILGVLLILFGLYNLLTPRLPTLRHPWLIYLFGFVSGILSGAYNTNGPPIVMYGTLARWTPDQFRATLQAYFLPVGLLTALGHAAAGMWSVALFQLVLIAIPVALLSLYLGGKLQQHIPAAFFGRLVYLFLVAIGIFLIY